MNILNYIERNHYLAQLFPEGIDNFFVGRLDMTSFGRVNLYIHILKKPAIENKKWGTWGINYNVIVVDLSVSFIKDLMVQNWQNNHAEMCEVELQEDDNKNLTIRFNGTEWVVIMTARVVTFQGSSTYLLEK